GDRRRRGRGRGRRRRAARRARRPSRALEARRPGGSALAGGAGARRPASAREGARGAVARGDRRVVRVAVLTTSYPRYPGDAAGRFVADAVERLRARGVEAVVVSPAEFRHYGIAYGAGVAGNLRRRPWLAPGLAFFLASFVGAARRAAVDVDL